MRQSERVAPFFGAPELADSGFASRASRREHRKNLEEVIELR
jgi:crotonobetainyl-CoA:carnitine CoA-transferase CaiB-like acyl-CoA transferase